jgi:hypothetical protein
VVAARDALLPALRRIGYAKVTVDLAGFVSGGYDQLLPAEPSGRNRHEAQLAGQDRLSPGVTR